MPVVHLAFGSKCQWFISPLARNDSRTAGSAADALP